MRYPLAIETGTEAKAFGVVVADLPGCFFADDTMDEAMVKAEEALRKKHREWRATRLPPDPHWRCSTVTASMPYVAVIVGIVIGLARTSVSAKSISSRPSIVSAWT